MAPSKFLDENVPIDEHFSDMTGMVSPNFIILDPLVFTVVLIIEFTDPVFEIGGFLIGLNLLSVVVVFVVVIALKFMIILLLLLFIIRILINA